MNIFCTNCIRVLSLRARRRRRSWGHLNREKYWVNSLKTNLDDGRRPTIEEKVQWHKNRGCCKVFKMLCVVVVNCLHLILMRLWSDPSHFLWPRAELEKHLSFEIHLSSKNCLLSIKSIVKFHE
ncbi:uncharacterized protein LOC143427163 [Xylocopa sonorina]|uniref:uncharacterized protein LOC143427163 n=1 Tax=Xylocopa sonorina TaxID=1818115 RepID=UPI00403AE6D6